LRIECSLHKTWCEIECSGGIRTFTFLSFGAFKFQWFIFFNRCRENIRIGLDKFAYVYISQLNVKYHPAKCNFAYISKSLKVGINLKIIE